MSDYDFWAHVHGRRAADFERVFGTSCVAIKSPATHLAQLPGFTQPQPVYLLDLDWVAEQGKREALVAFLAERFEAAPEIVDAGLDEVGMPILAAEVNLAIHHPQRWLW